MAPIPKVNSTLALPMQEIEVLEHMVADICLHARQDKMSAIEAVDAANQQKIEALKAQVSAMEKTVRASQETLLQSRARCDQKQAMSRLKRESEAKQIVALAKERQAEVDELAALRSQIAQYKAVQPKLDVIVKQRKLEVESVAHAYWAVLTGGPAPLDAEGFAQAIGFIQMYAPQVKRRFNYTSCWYHDSK